jgi:hypothetical protein
VGKALDGLYDVFVKPFKDAYNRVKGIIEDVKDIIKNTDFGSLLKSGLDAINPFRFMGGPVVGGQAYTVGEIGPEMFVPQVGSPKMVGEGGMETFQPNTAGTIIPSFMLESMRSSEALMRKHLSSQEKTTLPSMSTREVHTHYHNYEGDKLEATFTGDIRSEVDIERAMRRFHQQMKRDEMERR